MNLPGYMHKFSEDARKSSREPGEPPNAISAGALDKNFRACLPVESTGTNDPYKVVADADGWKLEGMLIFDVCENGQPRRYRFFAQKIGQS
jgi:hypothetical protein